MHSILHDFVMSVGGRECVKLGGNRQDDGDGSFQQFAKQAYAGKGGPWANGLLLAFLAFLDPFYPFQAQWNSLPSFRDR